MLACGVPRRGGCASRLLRRDAMAPPRECAAADAQVARLCDGLASRRPDPPLPCVPAQVSGATADTAPVRPAVTARARASAGERTACCCVLAMDQPFRKDGALPRPQEPCSAPAARGRRRKRGRVAAPLDLDLETSPRPSGRDVEPAWHGASASCRPDATTVWPLAGSSLGAMDSPRLDLLAHRGQCASGFPACQQAA